MIKLEPYGQNWLEGSKFIWTKLLQLIGLVETYRHGYVNLCGFYIWARIDANNAKDNEHSSFIC